MLNSKALTKTQSMILIVVIVVAAVGGVATYVFLSEEDQPTETIKIGVLVDLDGIDGKKVWQGVVLAAEQLNAEGGILGRQVEIVEEDIDWTDISQTQTALERLVSVKQADFVIATAGWEFALFCQDKVAEHEIVFLDLNDGDVPTQRVLDDYDKCKYYFSTMWNETSTVLGVTDGLLLLREKTGFNKIGILNEPWFDDNAEELEYLLPESYGFDLVYKNSLPYGTMDFSSYFADAESEGVEVLIPIIAGESGIPFVKEYYDRQSPLFIYGGVIITATSPESWEWTDGKVEHVCVANTAIVAGYPLTSHTIPTQEAYFDRWGEDIDITSSLAFDDLRFVLADAIKQAGTIETDAVITALEEINVETSNARNWAFSSSHGLMMGKNPNDPEAEYAFVMYFQWQNGELVPVYPEKIMVEAGATYTYPPWDGPWNK